MECVGGLDAEHEVWADANMHVVYDGEGASVESD